MFHINPPNKTLDKRGAAMHNANLDKKNESSLKKLSVGIFVAVSFLSSAPLLAEYYPQAAQKNTANIYQVKQHTQNNNLIVTVANARTGAHVVLSGTVEPYREVTLSAQTPGRIEYIAGKEGDWFNEGDILAVVDDDDILAQRRQAIAQLYGNTSNLDNANLQYTRELWSPSHLKKQSAGGMGFFPSMFNQFFGSMMPMGGGNNNAYETNPWVERDADLFAQSTHINQAKSRIYGTRSRIEEIDARLRDTRTIAPFEGVLLNKLVEVGDTLQPGQAILKFADTRNLQLKVDVPSRLVSVLEKDMMVPAKLDVGDTYINVRVAQIYPSADAKRHTVTVKFDLPADAPGGPGMYAEVMIPDANTAIRDMPVIPTTAIIKRGSLPSVYILNENNKAEMRLVRLGDLVDRHNVSVLSGLRAGEKIFSSPPVSIRSGWSPNKLN